MFGDLAGASEAVMNVGAMQVVRGISFFSKCRAFWASGRRTFRRQAGGGLRV